MSKHFFAGLLCVVSVLVYILVFLKNAWVGDDAYILFCSLEQLLDGNGPRWNPHERVQVFTSPRGTACSASWDISTAIITSTAFC